MIPLYDEPPSTNARIDWTEADKVALVLIDNPGKWALMMVRPWSRSRSINNFTNRYGKSFQFKTRANKEEGTLEFWASYQPKGES